LLNNQQNVSRASRERDKCPPSNLCPDHLDPKADYDDPNPPTIDAITKSTREKKRKQGSILTSIASEEDHDTATPNVAAQSLRPNSDNMLASISSDPADLEDEASSEGAFNPATGEINWDCPCLGGMAHGPCGEEFRAAFSCFVFSEEEPKGMDCIEKFQGMQNCFREHPDVYAAELEGDDDEELDEALEEERKGLVNEIKERREKAGLATEESRQGKRLLEVDPPVERKPLFRRPHTQEPTPPSIPPPASTEPHPPMSEDHEANARLRGNPLPTRRHVESNPDKAAIFDEDLKLMPKEWHDSRTESTPDTKNEK
jgi:hypothetical protein